MHIITIICLLLSLGYMLLIGAYGIGWARSQKFVMPAGYQPHTSITVIIPARNEESNIAQCLRAVLAQQYPAHLLEVIVVDDHSEDDTFAVARSFADGRLSCIQMAHQAKPDGKMVAYKKAALTAGIARAKGTLIVTTDADCTAPATWLQYIACIYEQQQPSMVVAPVIFTSDRSMVQVFQLIDFMSMQGITAAAHTMKMGNMSNGANLAFTKDVFNKVHGYEGVDNLASGDDYLLMMKISRLPDAKIAYLHSREAIVSTQPQPDWASFLQQRIRWASKSGKYNDPKLTAILLLVYLYNVSFIMLALLGFAHHYYWQLCGILILVKVVIEYIYIVPVAMFFRKMWTQLYYPLLQPLHIGYIALAGFLGFIGNYTWKDRRVN